MFLKLGVCLVVKHLLIALVFVCSMIPSTAGQQARLTQTYLNIEGKYQFQYPADWILVRVTSAQGKIESPYEFATPKGGKVMFVVNFYWESRNLEAFFKSQIDFKNSESYWHNGKVSRERLRIAGREAKKTFVDVSPDYREVAIYFKNEGLMYMVTFNEKCVSCPLDPADASTLQEVLSSFKFVK